MIKVEANRIGISVMIALVKKNPPFRMGDFLSITRR